MKKDHQYASPVFTVDSVLKRTIPLLLNRKVFGLIVLFMMISILVKLAIPRYHPFLWLLGLVPFYFFQGVMARVVYSVLTDGRETVGTAFLKTLTKLPSLTVAFVIMGVSIVLGYYLLVIPGLVMTSYLAVTLPACAVESLGPFAALRRSCKLVSGQGFRLFLLAVVMGIVLILAGIASAAVTGFVKNMFGFRAGEQAVFAIYNLPMAFGQVMYAVTYQKLRAVKEGPNVDHLAKVFD